MLFRSLSSLRTQRHLFSLSLLWLWFLAVMVVVFGCARSLKGVVGRGWVRCGLWVGVVVGQWWLWIDVVVGCGLWIGVVGSLVVDRRLNGFAPVGFKSWLGCDFFFLSAWVCVCVCLCLCLWFVDCARG